MWAEWAYGSWNKLALTYLCALFICPQISLHENSLFPYTSIILCVFHECIWVCWFTFCILCYPNLEKAVWPDFSCSSFRLQSRWRTTLLCNMKCISKLMMLSINAGLNLNLRFEGRKSPDFYCFFSQLRGASTLNYLGNAPQNWNDQWSGTQTVFYHTCSVNKDI